SEGFPAAGAAATARPAAPKSLAAAGVDSSAPRAALASCSALLRVEVVADSRTSAASTLAGASKATDSRAAGASMAADSRDAGSPQAKDGAIVVLVKAKRVNAETARPKPGPAPPRFRLEFRARSFMAFVTLSLAVSSFLEPPR